MLNGVWASSVLSPRLHAKVPRLFIQHVNAHRLFGNKGVGVSGSVKKSVLTIQRKSPWEKVQS